MYGIAEGRTVSIDRTDSDTETVEDEDADGPPPRPPDQPGQEPEGVPSRLDAHQARSAAKVEQAAGKLGEEQAGTAEPDEESAAVQDQESAAETQESSATDAAAETYPSTDVAVTRLDQESTAPGGEQLPDGQQSDGVADAAEVGTDNGQPATGTDDPPGEDMTGAVGWSEESGGPAETTDRQKPELDEDASADDQAIPEGEADPKKDEPSAEITQPEDSEATDRDAPNVGKPPDERDGTEGSRDSSDAPVPEDQSSRAGSGNRRSEATGQEQSGTLAVVDAGGEDGRADEVSGATEGTTDGAGPSDSVPGSQEQADVGVQDEPGSWRGDAAGQYLNAEENLVTGHALDQVRNAEPRLTDDLRDIDQELPDGRLVGLENRLKGEDRFKEKVAAEARDKPGRSFREITDKIPDAVRYTYQFDKEHYVQGCRQVRERLEARGHTMTFSRNSWGSQDHKGVNTRWRTPEGQLFEVQLHTPESFQAKQDTHRAYERLRTPGLSKQEHQELRAYQREISAQIPVPEDFDDIADYREKGH